MNTELEKQAIQYLKSFEPNANEEPYYLAYSGGKDSDTILILAELAGVRYEAVHNLTTVDAPETVNYVKSNPKVQIERPEKTMWQLIPEKTIPPTRLARYCCDELKERGGMRRKVVTGVRKYESVSRSKSTDLVKIIGKPKTTAREADEIGADYWQNKQGGVMLNNDNGESRELVEHCYKSRKVLINPIYDWTDDDVWEFLKHYGCKSNPLYECGAKRIGCIGCPLASTKARYSEFDRYPKYKLNYIRAFDRMVKARKEKGLPVYDNWQSGEDVFRRWMGEDINQITFEELMNNDGL